MNLLQRILLPKQLQKFVSSLEVKAWYDQLTNTPIGLRYDYFSRSIVLSDNPQNVRQYVDNAYNVNAIAYSAISIASEKASTIPWIAYKVKNTRKLMEYELATKSYSGTPVHLRRIIQLKEQALDEISGDNDAIKMWENPNESMSGPEFRAALFMFKMLCGAGVAHMNRGDSRVKPQEMNVLPPYYIRLQPDQSLNHIVGIDYTITGNPYPLEVDDVMYWKYHNPNWDMHGNHLYGQAPLRAAGVEIEADNQNVLAQKFMFENSGVTGMWTPKDMLSTEAIANYPGGPDAAREALTDLQRREDGTQKRPYFNVPSDYHSYGMDAKEMDLVAARRISKEFILNVLNFPPALMSLERATENNYEGGVKYLVTNTIYANLCSMRDRIANKWFLQKQWGYTRDQMYYDFDLTAVPELQDDMQKMVDSLMKSDWLTYDEKREAMKYDSKGGAYDTAYISGSLKPIEQVFEGLDEPIDPGII